MAKKYTLIHTALLSEAQPILRYFGLRQVETKPFKLFRSVQLLLIVSGVGKEATQKALDWIIPQFQFSRAINVGIAGCSDTAIQIGELFTVQGGPKTVSHLPLITTKIPLQKRNVSAPSLANFITRFFNDAIKKNRLKPYLVDMEASHFIKSISCVLNTEDIHVIKVVADHLDNKILKKTIVDELINTTLPLWADIADTYPAKVRQLFEKPSSQALTTEDREAIRTAALSFRFSHQEIKTLIEIAIDFTAWDEQAISHRLQHKFRSRKEAFNRLRREWEEAKNKTKTYDNFTGYSSYKNTGKELIEIDRPTPGFGHCPVASLKTRCCNIRTLDVVEGCGFDCSYCSIRYFYNSGTVGFHRDIRSKLKTIKLNPHKIYHIGTGQSSDSLMWGNRFGILDDLLDFATVHPNIILEFKTKSDKISHLLHRDIPANVITTWSLNPQIIIDNEEHLTASLNRRIESARELATRGHLVGFHFHPMVHYDRWEMDYGKIIENLLDNFHPADVAMVSFGSLTFIKPVIKKIREHSIKSRILQMPREEIEGKLSYPLDIKRDMFRFAYQNFAPWHDEVFFYLCMEDASLWTDVFGHCYHNNEKFEAAMINTYRNKMMARC